MLSERPQTSDRPKTSERPTTSERPKTTQSQKAEKIYRLPTSVTSLYVKERFLRANGKPLDVLNYDLEKSDKSVQQALDWCNLSAALQCMQHNLVLCSKREEIINEMPPEEADQKEKLISEHKADLIKRKQMFLKTLGSLGVASLELGEYKAALKHLLRLQEFVTAEGSESGLEAPPETVLHLYLCLAYCGIGQHQDALIQINHCIAEHPTSGDYQMIRLKIYMSTGQFQIACKLFNEWSADPVDHPELATINRRLMEQAVKLHREALDLISREQFKSAVTVLDEAIGISPGSLAIRRDRARVLKHLKLFQRSLDDMEWIYVVQKKSETDSKAGKVYEDKDLIIEIAELHQLFAGWLMEQPVEGQMAIFQREEKVMGHYQKAIELRPQESRYYKIFAQFLEKIKRLEDAVDMYTLYLSKQQHDPDVTERSVYLLIKLANQTAMQDEKGMRLALRRYSRALELQPTNMDALFGRVRLYVRMQSYQEAKADLLQILQLEPGQADAVRMLMEVKSHEGSIVD